MARRVRRLDRVRFPCVPLKVARADGEVRRGTATTPCRSVSRSPSTRTRPPSRPSAEPPPTLPTPPPARGAFPSLPRDPSAWILTTSKSVCSVTVTVVDGSDRTDFTTFSKAAYSALGGNLDTGMLPVVLSLSKDAAAAAAKKVAAVNVDAAASSATSAAAAAAAPSAQAPTTTAAPAPSSQVKVAVQAPTTTAVDAAASSAAAKKAYGASRRTGSLLPSPETDAGFADHCLCAQSRRRLRSLLLPRLRPTPPLLVRLPPPTSEKAERLTCWCRETAASSKAAADAAASSSAAAAAAGALPDLSVRDAV